MLRIYNKNPDFSERKIARALNISRPVVHQWLIDFKTAGVKYDDIKNLDDHTLLDLLQNQKQKDNERYSRLAQKFDYFVQELKKRGVTLNTLWEEYIAANPDGYSYSRFSFHFKVWKDQSEISMHIEHKAGDKMFVDFAGDTLHITDPVSGKQTSVETFVAILPASHYTYVECTASQRKEDFIEATENALLFFDGVPAAIVPDNLKAGVKNACKYEPDINPEYADFARHYDTVILPARAYKPKDKALVENAVRLVYRWIYAPLRNRTFHTLKELNAAIAEKLTAYNERCMQRTKMSRKQLYETTEKTVLNPLPDDVYEPKKFLNRKAEYNYHIYIPEDDHYYSVPYRFTGKKLVIMYTKRMVEIYCNNERIALHRRERTGKYTTLTEHMPPHHQYVAGWTPERFINWGTKLGSDVKLVIEHILSEAKHPQQAFKVCMGILSLEKKYGQDRLNNACARSRQFGYYSYKGIKNILINGLDTQEEKDLFSGILPAHENIRGKGYYN